MNFRRHKKNIKNDRSLLFSNMLGKVHKPITLDNKPISLHNNKPEGKYFWEHENEPSIWVSVLIPSYNTKKEYLVSCIDSIKNQTGTFGLEVVWINDCSNDINTNILVELLDTIIKPLKNCKLLYERLDKNSGISFCLHYGVKICSNEIILRMDSDDIMKYDRIEKQINFINSVPSCVMCGTNITFFENDGGTNRYIRDSIHKNTLTWEEYKKNPKDWILNHPTLCFKKTAILNIGNYRENFTYPFEDLELELRVLKNYGILYNLNESLVFYRIHKNQITNNMKRYPSLKKSLIQYMINN